MEKALEILTGLRQAKSYDENYPTDYEIQEAIEELKAKNERIKELEEAMKPKTCYGCVYGVFGVDSFGIEIECTLAYRCSRGQDDMFKPKDNA